MPDTQTVLGLLLAVMVLTLIARRLGVAYPILLVLGGLMLGFIPGLPSVQLRPELVFVLFLPPLLYSEAINTSYRDLVYNLRPIGSLAIGLVFATIAAVAVVAHAAIPGFTWPAAVVLGAVVAPTDELAASVVAERLRLPRRILTIIEDESLLNDASSLVIYSVAIEAVVSGTFSLPKAAAEFVLDAVGGVAVGLVAGYVVGIIRRQINDPPVENVISLLTGFVAYHPADALHLSGVLAVVAEGLFLGRLGPRFVAPRTRLQNADMWQIVDYLLNGLLFILVGLQLRDILAALASDSPWRLVWYAVIISLTVILLRVAWVFPATYVPRWLFPHWAAHRPSAPWGRPGSSPGPACAAPSRWPRRWLSRRRSPAARPSRCGSSSSSSPLPSSWRPSSCKD